MLSIIFQPGLEPVLIQCIVIGFEAILEKFYLDELFITCHCSFNILPPTLSIPLPTPRK